MKDIMNIQQKKSQLWNVFIVEKEEKGRWREEKMERREGEGKKGGR